MRVRFRLSSRMIRPRTVRTGSRTPTRETDNKDLRCESDEVDLEDPTGCGTVVVWPARMDACVATDQLPFVHRQPMRVTGIWNEVHRLQHLAGRSVVPHETRAALAVTLTVV